MTLRRGNQREAFWADVQKLDLSHTPETLTPLILDAEANFRAMNLAAKLKNEPGSHFSAVYLIAPTDDLGVVKVGIADSPLARLCALQIGNWNKLEVKGLLWYDRGPGEVEKLVHRAAKEMDIWLRGEWIAASVDEAAQLVLKAARYAKRPCYDSAVWLSNWSHKVDALADSKGIKARIAA